MKKKKSKRHVVKSKPTAFCLKYMPIGESPAELFVTHLDEAIKFHRDNQNDPHNIGNTAVCVLSEVRDAFAKAYGIPATKP